MTTARPKARIRPCAGCGRALSGYTGARCVLGCGAYYHRRGWPACANQHAKTCPTRTESP